MENNAADLACRSQPPPRARLDPRFRERGTWDAPRWRRWGLRWTPCTWHESYPPSAHLERVCARSLIAAGCDDGDGKGEGEKIDGGLPREAVETRATV